MGYGLLCDVNPKLDPCAGPSCAGHWGKFFEWPSAQSATPFYNEVKAVILRQGRRAYGQALANEADPQLPTPRGGPPGNWGPPARRTRAMPSALLPQDIKGYLLSTTVTRQILKNVTESVHGHVTFFVHPTGWKRCVTLRPYSTPWDGQNPAHFPPHVDKSRFVPDFFHPVGWKMCRIFSIQWERR